MTIGDTTAKLSVDKKNIEVREDQSDCETLRIWTHPYGIEQLMLNFNLWKKRSRHPTRHQQQYTGHSVPKRGL